jgi:hypothetical protein
MRRATAQGLPEYCNGDSREGKMLKASMPTAILVAGLITVLGCLVPPAAQAADPAFCAGYTDAALNQVRIALSSPNCIAGARGARLRPRHPRRRL